MEDEAQKRPRAEDDTALDGHAHEEAAPKKSKPDDVGAENEKSDTGVAAAMEADDAEVNAVPLPKEEEEPSKVDPVKLGPLTFNSGAEMFAYFYELLHKWTANFDFNKYEHLVLNDLILKGHNEPEAKIGPGIKAFQIRSHPKWHSKCYYIVRTNGTYDDFSYRKCVNQLMPLPKEFYLPSGEVNLEEVLQVGSSGKVTLHCADDNGNGGEGRRGRGGGGRGGRRGRGGHGRGGRWRR